MTVIAVKGPTKHPKEPLEGYKFEALLLDQTL